MLPSQFLRWRVEHGRLCKTSEPAESPGPGEVVVAVEGCAVGPPALAALAHEGVCPPGALVGMVVEGAADWVGRRVLATERLPCGECPVCQRGRGPACPRATAPMGFASHARLPMRYLLPVEGDLAPAIDPWRLAALAGPAARIYHAMVRVGLGPGEVAVFIGDGAEARLGARLAELKAAQCVVLRPLEPLPAFETAPRALRVFETTARADGARHAIALAQPTGTLSFVGEGLSVDLPRLPEIPILFSDAPHPDLLPELLALVVRGELDLVPLTGLVPDPQPVLEGRGPLCPVFQPA